jgi:tRNA-dihydrouridine synthase A
MIDWTYSSFRVFMRLLAPRALLYTEMLTTGAVEYNPEKSLYYNKLEHPIALQLGGSDPFALANAARAGEDAGYDEVNLNLGCPSDKVQAGQFGACLMNDPLKVEQCIKAMREAVAIPVTTKVRIGIDEQDSYEFFRSFVLRLVDAGTQKLIVHARKAWLHGLSPKENRTIPPVNYEFVYRIKQEIPHIPVVINGNITQSEDILLHLDLVDGVMLGRLACDNPYKIAQIHQMLYPQEGILTREEAIKLYLAYAQNEYDKGHSLSLLLKPLFNLYHGMPGAREWRRELMRIIQVKDLSLMYSWHFSSNSSTLINL